ncbi:hypothetical protein CAPTEDRAFT_212959 [Capitella teleta]|uniref:EF-hand domain-containing protein n=1 Tax=Capitella teleta TaxID=283909 RepID=R7UHQ5_CAPTE|nr:hypothetical protein CAPTEDRAFT_212959 [Capitella teleta]|eukprot:ELU02812.1 hypothetical protein CAPTEDRAFT_212959 [Capitella teleta]
MTSIEVQAPSTGSKLPETVNQGIYSGKFKDRAPDTRTAGKLTTTGDNIHHCLITSERPESPAVIRRFRDSNRPDAGRIRIFYGRATDPHLQWAKEIRHGLNTQPSYMAGGLVNPEPKSLYQQRMLEKKESLYATHKRAPLGSSHDQRAGFPENYPIALRTFGIRTEKNGFAGELVNPDKSRVVVAQESEIGRDLYRESHKDYKVGEQTVRNYKSASYNKENTFGGPTPHDNTGKQVKTALHWLTDSRAEKATPIVSKKLDDFRERTQPQLGKVHDPIKDTMHVPPDHTFGILIKPDEYGVGDLMHSRSPGSYLRGQDRQLGVIAAMRQHLKKVNYQNFNNLLHAFRHYDKTGTGKISLEDLQQVCLQFDLPVDPELLVLLVDYCDEDKDGKISYVEFSNFLNWKDKMPTGLPKKKAESASPRLENNSEETLPCLQKQIDANLGGHKTSASMINAVIGGIDTQDYRKYGVPTIRSDLAAPRIKRVSDRTNYGDECDIYGLTNPSIFSLRGLGERDFLIPRSKEELRAIFMNIGVRMEDETFDRLHDNAVNRHPKGHVSVEAMRNVLDEAQALHMEKIKY